MESADQLWTEGRYQESEAVFRQLFSSVRANSGLFHEHQFAVLDRLIQINLVRADWPSLKQHLDYQDWLINRLYTNNPLQLAEHLQNNAAHHELAAQATNGPARNWHLVQSRHQLWRAISALESLPAESHRLPALLHRIVMHHYALGRQGDLRWLTSFEARSDEPAMISGWALQGNEVNKRSYEIGAELITRIIRHYELNPDTDPALQAALMAQLMAYRGDWDFLFERDRSAFVFYQGSLKLTEETSCPETLSEALFGSQVQLPLKALPRASDICSAEQPDTSIIIAAGTDTTIPGPPVYRPRWSQNQWLMASPVPALSSTDTETQHD